MKIYSLFFIIYFFVVVLHEVVLPTCIVTFIFCIFHSAVLSVFFCRDICDNVYKVV